MARIKCSLVLTGDTFDPSEVSRRAGFVPTLSWKKGDLIGPSIRRRTDNGWKLSVEERASDSLEDVLRQLTDLLEPQKAVLRALIDRHGLEAEFACAVYLGNGAVPSMHLDRGLIGALRAYDAELDVDVYPSPDEPVPSSASE